MKDVRITVKRITVYRDLMEEYENPIEHACDMAVGMTFISKDGKRPEGMCDEAWKIMEPYVTELESFTNPSGTLLAHSFSSFTSIDA